MKLWLCFGAQKAWRLFSNHKGHNVCFCWILKNNIFDYAILILSKVLKLSLKELKNIEPMPSSSTESEMI